MWLRSYSTFLHNHKGVQLCIWGMAQHAAHFTLVTQTAAVSNCEPLLICIIIDLLYCFLLPSPLSSETLDGFVCDVKLLQLNRRNWKAEVQVACSAFYCSM